MTTTETIKLTLDSRLRMVSERLAENKAKLQENFTYQVNWVLKDIYTGEMMLFILNKIESLAKERTLEEAVEVMINHLEKQVENSWSVRSSSSCEVSNMTSTWAFMTNMDMIKFLKQAI